MKTIKVDKPTRIVVGGKEKLIRAGETVSVDSRRKDHYSAYPIVVSRDIAETYLGLEPKATEEVAADEPEDPVE